MRAGAAVSPASLAQPVVNHRALDAVSAKARKAAAASASSQSEGMRAPLTGIECNSCFQLKRCPVVHICYYSRGPLTARVSEL